MIHHDSHLFLDIYNTINEHTLNAENAACKKNRVSCAEDCATLLGNSRAGLVKRKVALI